MDAGNQNMRNRDFPGGPVVRTWRFHCRDLGSIPGRGTKIPQAAWLCQNKERKNHNSHFFKKNMRNSHSRQALRNTSLTLVSDNPIRKKGRDIPRKQCPT